MLTVDELRKLGSLEPDVAEKELDRILDEEQAKSFPGANPTERAARAYFEFFMTGAREYERTHKNKPEIATLPWRMVWDTVALMGESLLMIGQRELERKNWEKSRAN